MRLAGIAKAGWYPSPPAVVERVARMIVSRERHGVSRLLDPCCGEGAALAQLAERLRLDGASVETYGVELHRERHEEAKAVLDRTLCSDTFQVTMANAAFDLLWLNPPYDYDDELLRQEHKFLLHCTRYLAPGGLLVFIVPQGRLEVSSRYLASHYHRLRCWRFPDPEFATYRQAVLLGVKKAEPSPDREAEEQVKGWSVRDLPPLPDDPDASYALTAGKPGPVLFQTRSLDYDLAVEEARRNGLWASPLLHDRLWPKDAANARPLMPLRKGHLAMLIAAGFLNNLCLEANGSRVLVKGRTYKEYVLTESTDDAEVHREVLRTSVVALDLTTGEFEEVQA